MNRLVGVFEGNEVRMAGTPESPLFVLADVCKVLDIGNASDVKKRLEEGVVGIEVFQTTTGAKTLTVINEDGLYDVIFDSRKPEARRFRKWVTSEVLPAIRKTGKYKAPKKRYTYDEMEYKVDFLADAYLEAHDVLNEKYAEVRNLRRELDTKDELINKYKSLSYRKNSYNVSDIALALNISSQKVNKFLVQAGIQEKMDIGYRITDRFKELERQDYVRYYKDYRYTQMRWTEKGRSYVVGLINRYGYDVPNHRLQLNG
ncbi:BRO family protein [Exiguobacterium sp. s133]|uniref:BRO family protein n=1 Tax=Exiguobacterium sp. s133 TaxID=2751213 RepID=UPI001BE7F52A|nr:BRO family protein [Exiguobacterium sp. s133]